MDTFVFLGKKIPVYGALGVLGLVLGALYLWIVCRKRKKPFEDSLYIIVWAAIFAMLGAKLLYLLIEADSIISLVRENPDRIKDIALVYLTGGFVFYGGLLGAITGVVAASKFFSLNPFEELNMCIPIMPLAHGFGRIGCHLVGCCYGIEYSGSLAKIYNHSTYAPNNVGLFPVQLIESIFDFSLFIFLVVLELRKKYNSNTYIYLLSYSSARFVLEFFRGDAYRGGFAGLSTSQWISIVIAFLVIIQISFKKLTAVKNKNMIRE